MSALSKVTASTSHLYKCRAYPIFHACWDTGKISRENFTLRLGLKGGYIILLISVSNLLV